LKEDFEMEKKEFTLGTLIQLNIVNYQEQIQNISTTASQERMLTDQLTLIENQWNIKKFNVQPKEIGTTKDTYAITEFEDLFVDLDEALASMNNIIGSRYVKRLQKRYFHIIFKHLKS
jgi:dynein heavy chain, axonemal